MRVVVVSGIWPPDPGGPASHAPALADFLAERGHAVEVVTTADAEPAPRRVPGALGRRVARRFGTCGAALLVRRRARRADVVYATSMIRRAAIGARLARRPLVVKLVSDEVFERRSAERPLRGTLDEFQRDGGGARTRFLRATRNRGAPARAPRLLPERVPARRRARAGGSTRTRVSVLPNPAPEVPALPPRDELRAELGLDGHDARLRRPARAAEGARRRARGARRRART